VEKNTSIYLVKVLPDKLVQQIEQNIFK